MEKVSDLEGMVRASHRSIKGPLGSTTGDRVTVKQRTAAAISMTHVDKRDHRFSNTAVDQVVTVTLIAILFVQSPRRHELC